MASSTIFRNFTVPVEKRSLLLIGNDIANGKYKAEVEEIRALLEQGKAEEAASKKKQLLAFTPSAVFTEKRQMPFLEMYSGFVHLDFDKLTPEQLDTAFKVIAEIPYTFLCFISPSGNGLKVFIEVNTDIEHHDTAYLQVQQFYEEATGLKADPSCKDITRLCFMSYHPGLYKNIRNEKFKVQLPETKMQEPVRETTETISPLQQSEPEEDLNTAFIFNQQIQFTNQKSQYTDGNRNNYIYRLASNCNRAGLSQSDVELLCTQHFDLPEREILEAIKSAYTHHKPEFAKFANTAKLQSTEQQPPQEDYLKATPTIPEELYLQIPDLLQHGAMAFTDERERDVFLTGALAILSGCLPGVKGVYAGNEVFPNVFSFAIAPAASGKGALKFAKMLADDYHSFVLKASREAEMLYNQELSEHKQRISSKKKGDTSTEEPPTKPTFKVVYIPANTSYAKILWHLEQNEGTGIICETEADTLGNVFKQEWGSYSDMLRKSFHHERLSSSRKGNNEFTEVNAPSLSIALSGTPNQVTGLIASSEDGLFSRFLFYAFKVEQRWKDVSPNANNINLTEHFKVLSGRVFNMVQFLQREETIIELTTEQWQQLNHHCEGWLNEVTMFTAEEAASIVKRLGLILYRMAMIFTSLRKFENGEAATLIVCTDEDFNTALRLAEIYLHHSILMFNNLPKQSEATQFKTGDSKRKFFETLPAEFTRQQAVEIGKQFQLSPRTVDDILHNATGKALEKLKAGHYRKI
ncbi:MULTISPECIES: DUF3987 domain-containing protein [Sediminibacterium]|jgi:hypothetical protein|uniref:DUF3987 domain-containing protein n=1 Tax=Sediminibacterium TaxID=504481 RepID=UPI00047BCA61|nr:MULTISPECIES: DUF3987 domain-containing protein [Sediminibacterium]OYY11957.1 MAG: hypothetical protein B7Y66_00900 [Sphingobacteriia bacterium 35-36-14]OYZ54242.1 MAG: hypothetical protein B7Y11_06435 [Sphingobacteriia bacterium 24-36-13]OZA65665.1 MAG: hypothetical protein B7X68_03240 [Sphingobacteriia bacterium 39-36-14]HQS23743.1 DUF3987 domain-containing protein [Sediminibacterium sp.]HQS34118.1 DUF3987 domain-containing protein [Sediminibacterium sp.]